MRYHSFNISRIFFSRIMLYVISITLFPLYLYTPIGIFSKHFFSFSWTFSFDTFFLSKKKIKQQMVKCYLCSPRFTVSGFTSLTKTQITAPKLNSKFQFVVSFLVFSVYNFHPRTRKASSIRAKFMWLVSFSIILNLTFYFYNILIIK